MVLSSTKIYKLTALYQRNRSLIKMLKRIGPTTETCIIPVSNSLERLCVINLNILLTSLLIGVEKRQAVFNKVIKMQFRNK